MAVGAVRLIAATGLFRHPSTDSFAQHLIRETEVVDGVWCWRGICPGQTTRTAAAQIVSSASDIDPTVSTQQTRYIAHRVRLGDNAALTANLILTTDTADRIDTIRLFTVFTVLRLDDLITHFGTPTLVSSSVGDAFNWRTTICFTGGACALIFSRQQYLALPMRVSQLYLIGTNTLSSAVPVRGRWLNFARWQ
jgi:hypothetical protein